MQQIRRAELSSCLAALRASAETLQTLKRHSEAQHRSLLLSASAAAENTGCSRDTAGSTAANAALGILRCLPYELPSVTAAAILQDPLSPGSGFGNVDTSYATAARLVLSPLASFPAVVKNVQ